MQLIATVEQDFQTCHCHAISCDCDEETHQLTVHGYAWLTSEGWDSEIEDVIGLPEGWAFSDLDPRDLERCKVALVAEAEYREAQRESARQYLGRLVSSLGRQLNPAPLDPPLDKDERIGALRFALTQLIEQLTNVEKQLS